MPSFAQRAISAIRGGRVISVIKRRLARRYLRRCKGVIHVGANDGAERDTYARHGLRVLWVEPLPDAFSILQTNIAAYDGQEAVRALITDRDGDEHVLHVSNIAGLCSSILSPQGITEILPHVQFTDRITLTSTTLPTIMRERDMSLYDALVIDTQGAELLVLRGAASILHHFNCIECEGADFEVYAGYPSPGEIRAFLADHGFRQIREDTFRHSEQGREFDMLFCRG